MSGARGFRGFLQRFFFPDVETLLTASEELDERLDRVDKNVGALDKNIGVLGGSIGALDKNMGSLDASLALLVDQGLARLNDGMRQLDQTMGVIHKGIVQLNLGMDQLNKDTDEREKDLSTRLSVLKAKLQDDHSRAMGEIAALLEEHAYVAREEAAVDAAVPVAQARPEAVRTERAVPVASSPAAPWTSASATAPVAEGGIRQPPRADPAAMAAAPAFATRGISGAEGAAPPGSRGEAGMGHPQPARTSLAIPTYAQQQEEELESRADALADPVATISRLSAIFGRPKSSEPFAVPPEARGDEKADVALDFAAILEGIKRSGLREAQAGSGSQLGLRPESRAL